MCVCVYAFSICATALGKRPPAPPYHTVQVTILRATTTTTTTTAQITMHAFSICGTTLGKRPPPLPSHSASYNITANHHRHHLDHHSTSYNACIQYMRHCFRKKNRPPVQVTEGQKLHCHHWRARCSKHL